MKTRFLIPALLLGCALPSFAVPIIGSSTGLASPTQTYDFTNPAPTTGPNGTGSTAGVNDPAGFSGSTFANLGLTISDNRSALLYDAPAGFFLAPSGAGSSGDYISSFHSNGPGSVSYVSAQTVTFGFARPVSGADFFFNAVGTFTFTATLGGVQVDSFSSSVPIGGGFFGFNNISFDSLSVSGVNIAEFDTVQVVVTPEIDPNSAHGPLALALFSLALVETRRRRKA